METTRNTPANDHERGHAHGSGGAVADAAVEGRPGPEHREPQGASARIVTPLPEGETPDHLADKKALAESDEEALTDESIEESFPASDPPSASKFT